MATRLQVASAKDTTFASSVTATFANPLTPGSTILLSWEGDTGVANSANTPTDTATHTYTRRAGVSLASTFDLEIWTAPNSGSQASNAVTVTDTIGGSNGILIIEEWSGISTVSPLDTSKTASGTTSSSFSTGAFTTTNANDLIWVACAAATTNALTVGSGYSNLTQTSTSSTTLAIESKIVSVAGSNTGTMSLGVGNASYTIAAVAMELATTTQTPPQSQWVMSNRRTGPHALRQTYRSVTPILPPAPPVVNGYAAGLFGGTYFAQAYFGDATGSSTTLVNLPLGWIRSIQQPQRNRLLRRQQPNYNQTPLPIRGSVAPYLSYWVKPTNEPVRSQLKRIARQQPPAEWVPPVQSSNAVTVANNVAMRMQPANQPLRSRTVKRQQPVPVQPPYPAKVTEAPYVSYWVHPTEQPQRNRVPKRLQVPKAQPSYPPLKSEAPYLSEWVQPIQQPLRGRVPKRLQFKAVQPPFPPLKSTAPYLSNWKQPTGEPLKNRLPKRLQVNRVEPPYPPLPSKAPYLSYWKQPVNEPLKSRTPRRQQPIPPANPWYANKNTTPSVSSWKQSVHQPLRSRAPKRQQPLYNHLPLPPRPSAAPYLSYWKQPVQEPLRNRIRQRQQPAYPAPFFELEETRELPTGWIKPVSQPMRSRVLKRQQPAPFGKLFFITPVSMSVTLVGSSSMSATLYQPVSNAAANGVWTPTRGGVGGWNGNGGQTLPWVPRNEQSGAWNGNAPSTGDWRSPTPPASGGWE